MSTAPKNLRGGTTPTYERFRPPIWRGVNSLYKWPVPFGIVPASLYVQSLCGL